MEREARSAKTKIIAGVGAILVLGLGVWGIGQQTHTKTTTTTKPVSASVVKAPTTYVKYQGVEGKTALELLKTHAKVQTKSSSLGDFVVSINGNDGGGKKYWLYYVNGKEAEVGAGAYETKTGDLIEWKLK